MSDVGMTTTSSDFKKLIALDEHPPILRKKTLLGGFEENWSYGDILAKDSNGKLRKVAKTVLTENETSETTLHVEDPGVFLVGDTVKLGGSSEDVTAVDVDAGTITVDGNMSGSEDDEIYIDGDEIVGYAILAEEDVDVTGSDVSALVLMHGVVYEPYVGNVSSDLKEDLESRVWFKSAV